MSPEARPTHSVSVAAVVTDADGRLLLIRRMDTNDWEIPGGVVELNEDLHQALRREVADETGFQIEPGHLTGVYKNMALGIVALVFHARVIGGIAHASEESREVAFVSRDKLPMLVGDRIRVRIEDALRPNQGDGVPIRAHSLLP